MRKLLALLAVILLASPGVTKAGAAEVTVDLFYRSLEPHGSWIETADYGYVWRPREAAENWRPYTVGSWAYTDAGWTWVSEEPFGWATYHYGRWVRIEPVGWAWVPDTEWAPAWVSWRRSPKYVGWAPLPPEARFRKTVGIKSWADTYYDIGPEYYSFVEVREFGSPRLARVVIPPRENITIVRETKNITNITVVNNYVFNGGPEYAVIVRESAEPVRRLRIERRMDIDFGSGVARENVLQAKVAGDTLRIVAPDVRFVANAKPARVASRLDRVQVDRGWKVTNVDQRQVEQLRTEMRKEAPKPPAELPPQPKFERAVADVSGDRARERRGGQAAEAERLSVPGTPAGGAQPGATVGTPGTEAAQSGSQPAKTERMESPAAARPAATPGEAKEKDRPKRQKGKERQRPGSTEPTPSAATPSATTPATTMPDATTAPDAAPATTGETDRDATERDRTKRRGRTQPDAVTPGAAPKTTVPSAASPTSETTTAEPGETGAKKKERAADRGKKRDRSQREQPGAPSTTTPDATPGQAGAPSAPEAEQPRKGREGRGARSAESPATARPEASEGSPSATMPSERPQTSRERRSPAEDSKRPGRDERPNRPQRDERPDRTERGAGRPEASASERGAGERSVERSQPRANARREDGGSARGGKAERSQGAGERSGGRHGGAAAPEGAEASGARGR